jgi:hypothetical protein
LTLAAQQDGERVRREALIRTLSREGIPYEERPLFAEYGGFGSSVHVAIPGNEAETTLVLAVPLSGPENSGGELSYAAEGALSFIRKILRQGSGLRVRAAFLGDESSNLPEDTRKETHRGLRDLLALTEDPDHTLVLYLDFREAPSALVIRHGSRGAIAPLNVLRPLPAVCRSRGIPYTFAVRFNELHKLGILDGPPALELVQGAGIPALYMTGRYDGAPIAGEDLGDMLFEYANSLDLSGPRADTHYSIIHYGNNTLFISELTAVILLFALSALFLGVFLVRFTALKQRIQWNDFARCFLAVAAFGAVFLLALLGAALLFTAVLRGFALSPDYLSYGALALQFAAALALFSLSARISDFVNIPGKANFYGDAAVLLIAFGMSAAAFLDITFIPAFVWAFLCAFPAVLSKKPLIIRAWVLLMSLQGAGALVNVMEEGNARLLGMILSARPVAALFITTTVLPFLLIFHRSVLLGRKKKPRPAYLAPPLILLALSLGGLVLYGYFLSKRPVSAPVRRIIREGGGILDAAVTERVLLERRIIEIRIEAAGNPVRFDLYLDTGGALPVIYDAPMPFEYHRDSVEFLLGEGPPNPFSTELVLPLDFSGSLRAEAVYPVWDGSLDPRPPPDAAADYALRVITTVPLPPPDIHNHRLF